MKMHGHCSNCGVPTQYASLGGKPLENFCSDTCKEFFQGPRKFCLVCRAETRDTPAPAARRILGTGIRLLGATDECLDCRSSIRRLLFTVLWLPVASLGRFRILQVSPRQYQGRKLLK